MLGWISGSAQAGQQFELGGSRLRPLFIMCMYVCTISAADARSAPPLTRGVRAPGRQKKRKEKEPKTLSAELARLTPDTRQQAVGRAVATATAMAVQRASYAVCEGVFVRERGLRCATLPLTQVGERSLWCARGHPLQ